MHRILYLSRILMLTTMSSVVGYVSLPEQEGCTGYFDSTECKLKYECRNYIELNNNFRHLCDKIRNWPDCQGTNYNYYISSHNYGRILCGPVHLKFSFNKEIYSSQPIPNRRESGYNYENTDNVIVYLDLSNEELTEIPTMTSMENLAVLNLSRNSLTEAKLYNSNELKSLKEIDYSYNVINAIEVKDDTTTYKNLKILNISHNYIVNLPNSIFDNFKDMESLDISYNYIDIMNSLTFEGLKNILYLNLSHNRVVDLSSSLIRFNKLMELDLSFNRLTGITNNNFENLIELKKLDLSNNEIYSIQSETFKNTPSLITLILNHNKLVDIDNFIFKNTVNLKNLDFSSNNIKMLPKNLFQNKNIAKFDTQGNQLEGSLLSGTFEGLGSVTDLDLSNHYYTSLEDFAFIGLDKLKTLTLKNNAIEILNKLCFKTLTSLKILDLSGNKINTLEFDKSDLFNLRELYLQDNNLFEVTSRYFQNFTMLQLLDISGNKISVIQPNSFQYLNHLMNIEIKDNPIGGILEDSTFDGFSLLPKLDISGTLFNTLRNNSFKGMTHLKELNISHCNVSVLEFNVFENTVTIEFLDLSFNKLSKFEINSTALVNLNQILLNNNVLKIISPASFKNLPRLNKLILSHNEIELLEKNIFSSQQDLRYLDISFNTALKFDMQELALCPLLVNLYLSSVKTYISFTNITKDVMLTELHRSYSEVQKLSTLNLGKLNHLENLFLDHNVLINIKVGELYNLSSLRILDLSYNNISYIQPGAFKDNIMLHTLNVSRNNLLSVSYGIFRGLNYLSIIDFSYNNIESFESERFYEVIGLTELYVDHNNINIFDATKFLTTSLVKLSIGDNPLPCDVLVNMNNINLSYNITAIHKDENNYENVNGVTCNRNRQTIGKHDDRIKNVDSSDKILTEIRIMIQNISKEFNKDKESKEKVEVNTNTQFISKMEDKISQSYVYLNTTVDILSNLTSNFVNESENIYESLNNTNILLNKILVVMNTPKKTLTTSVPKDVDKNGTMHSVLSYVHAMKQELEDEIAEEKANILTEMDKKIASINSSKQFLLSNVDSAKYSNSNELSYSKSLTFVEICLGLIVTILIGFIIFKIYLKTSYFTPRQSYSTRNLPDALDNSTL